MDIKLNILNYAINYQTGGGLFSSIIIIDHLSFLISTIMIILIYY